MQHLVDDCELPAGGEKQGAPLPTEIHVSIMIVGQYPSFHSRYTSHFSGRDCSICLTAVCTSFEPKVFPSSAMEHLSSQLQVIPFWSMAGWLHKTVTFGSHSFTEATRKKPGLLSKDLVGEFFRTHELEAMPEGA
jgi:hypothetical protein